MFCHLRFLLAALIFSFAGLARAEDPPLALECLSPIPAETGYPMDGVSSIVQTPQNDVWIGGDAGLYEVSSSGSTTGPVDTKISNGVIAMGWNNNQQALLVSARSLGVMKVAPGKQPILLRVTTDSYRDPVFLFATDQATGATWMASSEGLYVWDGGYDARSVNLDKQIQQNGIDAIALDETHHRLYIADSQGFISVDVTNPSTPGTPQRIQEAGIVKMIFSSYDDVLWIITFNSLNSYRFGDAGAVKKADAAIRDRQVPAAVDDKSGLLYIGEDQNLLVWEKNKLTPVNKWEFDRYSRIRSIALDKSGKIALVGTDRYVVAPTGDGYERVLLSVPTDDYGDVYHADLIVSGGGEGKWWVADERRVYRLTTTQIRTHVEESGASLGELLKKGKPFSVHMRIDFQCSAHLIVAARFVDSASGKAVTTWKPSVGTSSAEFGSFVANFDLDAALPPGKYSLQVRTEFR